MATCASVRTAVGQVTALLQHQDGIKMGSVLFLRYPAFEETILILYILTKLIFKFCLLLAQVL